MSKVIILGAGAAPGVPCLSLGFGDCDPNNVKNIRLRVGTYMEISGVKFLIDTSPDLRMQLIKNNIYMIDGVFYTHVHADHLHGIDDLREINRLRGDVIDIFASRANMEIIKQRFGYLVVQQGDAINPTYRAALRPNVFEYNQSFYLKDLKVTPILLNGHNVEVTGYIFNDGEVVHIADFKAINSEDLKLIKRQPEVLIMPLTTPQRMNFHAGLDDLIYYAKLIGPKRVIINHMAVESDYEAVKKRCLDCMVPGYDGMTVEW